MFKPFNKPTKMIGIVLLVLLLVAIVFYVILFVFSRQENVNQRLTDQVNQETTPALSEQYPEETSFIAEYFTLMKDQDYEELTRSYWSTDVIAAIRQECANPLGEDPSATTKSLWERCQQFDAISVEVISVEKQEETSIVTVQFFDSESTIIGLDVHPEWVRGHRVVLNQTPAGLRTADWQFLQ